MILANRWKVAHRIASGGFGRVHRATDISGGPDVAVKLLLIDDAGMSVRMARAATRITDIDHPGIVPIIDVVSYVESGTEHPAVVMELVRGNRTLQDTIHESTPLRVDKALELFGHMLDAVAHAHACGVIHRDLKPSNILEDPDTGRPRIVDFDLAKFATTSGTSYPRTRVGTQMGTPIYAAPELWNAMSATEAADTYSLGAILYELLTGTWSMSPSTFPGGEPDPLWTPPSLENESVPPAIDELVAEMMRHDPRTRPRKPDDYARILDEIAAYA